MLLSNTLSLVFVLLCPALSLSNGLKLRKCFGSNSGLSFSEDRDYHYTRLVARYSNCKLVQGNLELTGLEEPGLDLSFLQNIEEVTGYVLIALNHLPIIPLKNLKVIRGRELFEGKYSLFVKYNYNITTPSDGLRELRLNSLTEVIRGNVIIDHNQQLCFMDTIHWDDILNPVQRRTGDWIYQIGNDNKEPSQCARCSGSCVAGCWAGGNEMCQQQQCSSECGDARCRGPTPNDCCHSECAAGCNGPTASDCTACLHVNNGGSCAFACPPEFFYDAQSFRNVPNPGFKYRYVDQCVDNCPSNLLIDGNACVKSCRIGFHSNGEGKCIPCIGGACDKECFGVGQANGPLANAISVDSSNVHHFEGCTIVKGNIIFETFAFSGDLYTGVLPMNASQLTAFKDVKTITGYLYIVTWPKELSDFAVFKSLETIGGIDLFGEKMALVIQDNTSPVGPFSLDQITSLGFNSLRAINHGNVYIGYCQNLCYDKLLNWTSVIHHPVQSRAFRNGVLLSRNGRSKQCNSANCDPECDLNGCWGPGPVRCFQCSHYSYQGSCLKSCPKSGVYADHNEKKCKPCHSICDGLCYGSGPFQCTTTVHLQH
ncbi:receptor tyrosine-protein kinase erbB-3-like [Clavelina lepadiformis]|uniref:receptor tyrosine-protein kinase erbB-3-like n=1 Tax=Clavelina lepadiformis TaxID=159417 RepID=UPI0040422543